MPTTPQIILIHGTWNSGANWTLPEESLLCKYLGSQIGPLDFHRLVWSGRNSYKARAQAADELQKMISSVSINNPDAPVYIVGHSHGGSIIAIAFARHKQLLSQVSGVAFLSTPFVRALVAPNALSLALLMAGAGSFITFCLGYMLLTIGSIIIFSEHLSNPSSNEFLFMMLLIFIVGVFLRRLGRSAANRDGDSKLLALVHDFNVKADNLPENTVFIRMDGDEAANSLGFVHICQRMLSVMLDAFIRGGQMLSLVDPFRRDLVFKNRAMRSIRIASTIIFSLFVIFILFMLFDFIACQFVGYWAPIICSPINGLFDSGVIDPLSSIYNKYAPYVFFAILGLLFIPVVFALAVGLAFGRLTLLSVFVHFAVEPTPAGVWTITQLSAPDESADWAIGHSASLRHSMVWSDPRCHQLLASWLTGRAATVKKGSGIR